MSNGMGNDAMDMRAPAIGRQRNASEAPATRAGVGPASASPGTTKRNPFEAPAARVEDVSAGEPGDLIENGQRVPVGNGVAWIGSGWELFKMAPGVWIGLCVAFVILLMVLSVVPIVNLALNLIMPLFVGGIMLGCKALEDGEPLQFSHLFAGFRVNPGQLVLVGVFYLIGFFVLVLVVGMLAGVLMGGAMMSGAVTSGTFEGGADPNAMLMPMLLIGLVAMLFAVPLAMAFWFAPALVVLHDVPAFAAMRMSFIACLKNFLPFLLYGVVLLLLSVLAILPLGLGFLVLWPVMWASTYTSYRDMFVG